MRININPSKLELPSVGSSTGPITAYLELSINLLEKIDKDGGLALLGSGQNIARWGTLKDGSAVVAHLAANPLSAPVHPTRIPSPFVIPTKVTL